MGFGGMATRMSLAAIATAAGRVAPFVGVDEPLEQLSLLGTDARGTDQSARRAGQVLLQCDSGSLEGAVRRGDARVEQRGRVAGAASRGRHGRSARPVAGRQDL